MASTHKTTALNFEDGSALVISELYFDGSTLRRDTEINWKGKQKPNMAESWVQVDTGLICAAWASIQHREMGQLKADDMTLLRIRIEYKRLRMNWLEAEAFV